MDRSDLHSVMANEPVDDFLGAALAGRHLLTHPFYQRWEAGELASHELADYAGQYRHMEALFPQVLGSVVAGLPTGPARSFVAATLQDELEPVPHLTLFEDFAQAVGAPAAADPMPATTELVECYRSAISESPVAALAAIGAYEVQSPAVASTKGEGLRRHYGVDKAGTRFWDVHAQIDRAHAAWMTRALAELAGDGRQVIDHFASKAAGAWWDFLSERELPATRGS